jgi:uncharacterized caspase-like protein
MAGVLIAVTFGFFALTGASLAQQRVALVIGNSSYQAVSALPNPTSDARLVAQLLQEASFEVTVASDLGQTEMRQTVQDFAALVAGKGPDTVVLVFYAGHGLQLEGENFLVPVDARIEREEDVAGETMRLIDLVKAFENAQPRMLIVMLDACRNNPFAAVKGAGRGLATVDAPTGSLVAYATAPGAEAEDGRGTNSPYTSAFVDVAKEPGLAIEQLFKRVRLRVHKETDRRQTPWESSSLTGDFSFFTTAPLASPVAPIVPPPPPPPPAAASPAATGDLRLARPLPAPRPAPAEQPAPGPTEHPPTQSAGAPDAAPDGGPPPAAFAEVAPPVRPVRVWADELRARSPDEAYDLAIEEDLPEVYEEFIRIYPEHPLAVFVRRSLIRRVEAIAWRNAAVVNTPDAYRAYLSAYPGGNNAVEALRLRERPRVRPIDPVFIPRVSSRPPGIPQGLILPARPVAPAIAPGGLPGQVPSPVTSPVPSQLQRPAAIPPSAPAPSRPVQLPRPAALPAVGTPPGQVRRVPGQPPRPGIAPATAPGQTRPTPGQSPRPGSVPAVAPGQVQPGQVRPGQVRPGQALPSQVRPAPGQGGPAIPVRPTAPAAPARPIAVAPPRPAPGIPPQLIPGQIPRPVVPGIPAQIRPALPAQVRPLQAKPAAPSAPATVRPAARPAAAAPARAAAPKAAPKCRTVNGKQVCPR